VERPNPGGIPIPRHPDAARITRAYKLRQQPAETPGAWTARGLFLWRSSDCQKFFIECRDAATLSDHWLRSPCGDAIAANATIFASRWIDPKISRMIQWGAAVRVRILDRHADLKVARSIYQARVE
jgi:hypothetical protein